MIAQALVGISGVTLGQYGSIAVDVDRLDPEAPVATDLGHDAYGGLRAFLATAAARQLRGPVKWQFTGPVTLGAALTRVGVPRRAGVRRRRPGRARPPRRRSPPPWPPPCRTRRRSSGSTSRGWAS